MAHLPRAEGPTPLDLKKSNHPLSPSTAHDGTFLLLVVGHRVSKGPRASSASWVRGPANFTRQRESGRPTPARSSRSLHELKPARLGRVSPGRWQGTWRVSS